MSAKVTEKRFWQKVDKDGPVPFHRPHLGKCWIWLGPPNGEILRYGKFANQPAHRWIYERIHGPLGNIKACHKCDNPICVRPSHLFAGTSRDNYLDCLSKGRHRQVRGEDQGLSKLTDAKVLSIRERSGQGESHKLMAREFGVNPSCIDRAVAKITWKHL